MVSRADSETTPMTWDAVSSGELCSRSSGLRLVRRIATVTIGKAAASQPAPLPVIAGAANSAALAARYSTTMSTSRRICDQLRASKRWPSARASKSLVGRLSATAGVWSA